MSIKDLKTVLIPPTDAIEPGDHEQWSDIESKLGTVLPSDYKKFIQEYGSGYIAHFLTVLNPFSVNKHINFLELQEKINSAYKQHRDKFPEYAPPFPAYPEVDGLIPWGVTDNGDTLNWIASGDPDVWNIVIYEGRVTEIYDLYHGSMTDFLVSWLTGRYEPVVIGGVKHHTDFPSFEPLG